MCTTTQKGLRREQPKHPICCVYFVREVIAFHVLFLASKHPELYPSATLLSHLTELAPGDPSTSAPPIPHQQSKRLTRVRQYLFGLFPEAVEPPSSPLFRPAPKLATQDKSRLVPPGIP